MFTGRTLLLFFIAILLAIGAVFIAQRWVASMAGGPVQQPQFTKVIVAAKDIPQWQTVDAVHIKEADWPKSAVTSDMFTDKNKVYGRVAIDTIYAGEPLSAKRVLEPKGGSVFSLRIPENMRAFTIRVNDVSGVGGFLLPDNRVDVIASRKLPGSNEATVTETIVQDIKVLAVDQESSSDKNKPIVVRSVTLEMTPQQAETVFRAEEEGSIQLALRNPTDEKLVRKAEAVVPAQHVQAPPPRAAAPAGKVFAVIRGTASSKVRCVGYQCAEQAN